MNGDFTDHDVRLEGAKLSNVSQAMVIKRKPFQ
jgi:hypothetical protein